MARVFVTGSTDGLGRAAAQTLIAQGHEIVLHARSQERAAAHADRLAAKYPESRVGAFWTRLKEYPQRARGFLHEVRVEMRQVTWPTRHDVFVTTFVVIVAVAFFGIFFFAVDNTVAYLMTRLFNFFKP